MSTYHLRCVFNFRDGRTGSAFSQHDIEAASLEDARDLALIQCTDTSLMRLVSAVLTGPDGAIAWSQQSPMVAEHLSQFGANLPPGAGT